MSITESDLTDAILEALEKKPPAGREPGTITTGELARDHHITPHTASKILEGLYDSGIVEKAYVKRVDGWGGNIRPKGYKLIRKGKETNE